MHRASQSRTLSKMKLGGLSILILTITASFFIGWYLVQEDIYCLVDGDLNAAGGFYAAYGGVYLKRGQPLNYSPDFFSILDLRREIGEGYTIALTKHMWSINKFMRKQQLYFNNPANPEKYLNNPPYLQWQPTDKVEESAVGVITISTCQGSLQDSPSLDSSGQQSNLQQLMARPVTTILLIIISFVAYYLWANNVDVSRVAFIYEKVVDHGEYWRMITASFSHVDIMHFGFNAMALYQLGDLEAIYTSAAFAYLSFDLVIITMLICVFLYHYLITRHSASYEYLTKQPAIGYSCVLFSWMVALSVRLSQYCPIFFFPSLCFDTWYIPVPFKFAVGNGSYRDGFPVNIGPFILLFITKLIIPRSSFIGHLSGIIIGYPLAWNLLGWLTPPILGSILSWMWLTKEGALVWTFPGYESTAGAYFSEFLPPAENRHLNVLRYSSYFLMVPAVVSSVYCFGWQSQLLLRSTIAFMCWSGVKAKQCEIMTSEARSTLGASHALCASLLAVSAGLVLVTMLCDLLTLGAQINSKPLLVGGCGLSDTFISSALLCQFVLIFAEFVYTCGAVMCLQDTPKAESNLQWVMLDRVSWEADLKNVGLNKCTMLSVNGSSAVTNATYGRGTLGGGSRSSISLSALSGQGRVTAMTDNSVSCANNNNNNNSSRNSGVTNTTNNGDVQLSSTVGTSGCGSVSSLNISNSSRVLDSSDKAKMTAAAVVAKAADLRATVSSAGAGSTRKNVASSTTGEYLV